MCRDPYLSTIFVNHLSHTIFVNHLCVSRGRRDTWRHPPSFRVAGVALGDSHLGFAWQAWHLWHWAGSGVALGRAWSAVTPRHFAWQALHLATSTFVLRGWHLAPSTFVSRGRRDTYGTGLALAARLVASDAAQLCVAGVALGDIHIRFAWQAWHLWHWAGSGGALGRR